MDTRQTKPNNLLIPAVVVALIVIVIIVAVYLYKPSTTQTPTTTNENTQQVPATTTPASLGYKNGTYTATGNYVSPGGPREIDLTLTIADNKITGSTFVGKATDPTSKRFQGEFADNYKAMIIGKNIDDVNLTKVSGSSLTPNGFDDALQKIKSQAKS